MPESFDFGGEIVWRPTPEFIERAHLTEFMRRHGIADFAELMERSTSDVPWFTDAVLKYLDIRFQEPYSQVVDLSHGIQLPGDPATAPADKQIHKKHLSRNLIIVHAGGVAVQR